MTGEIRAVFVVELDSRDVWAYPSLERAAGSVEFIDAENSEYEFFSDDGTLLDATVAKNRKVLLAPTSTKNIDKLMEHLRAWISMAHIATDTDHDDLVGIAEAISDARWKAQRPRGPSWLRRHLYGDGPPEFRKGERTD